MRTGASNRKIRELIKGLGDKTLIPNPEFQRRLVWSRDDKLRFVETVLLGYPFPEIYLANGEVNTETGEGQELLVDGQQRTMTLLDYFAGEATFADSRIIPPYSALDEEKKREFLNYDVAVRHLGDASPDDIIQIFRRINATRYALNDMEIDNAIFDGKLKLFCQSIAESGFFDKYRIFRPLQLRRMGDTRYILGIVVAMMIGYQNRDDSLSEYLARYNDEFPQENEIRERFFKVLAAVDNFELSEKSRAFKQADLFTLLVELDSLFQDATFELEMTDVRDALASFYDRLDRENPDDATEDELAYRRAVLQAANDRSNRRARGRIIRTVMARALNEPKLIPVD